MPDVINKFTKLGYEVIIESGAGIHAQATDRDYEDAGAKVSSEVLKDADVILSVQPLTPSQAANLKSGAVTISFLSPTNSVENIEALAKAGVTAFSMELVS